MGSQDEIVAYLRLNGPSLSSRVAGVLKERGLSNDAARKAVQRARPPVSRLTGLGFPNRQAFLYLQDQYRKDPYWFRLFDALVGTGSAFGVALSSLHASGGSMPKSHFGAFSGAPGRLRGQVGHERVLQVLTSHGLLEVVERDDVGQLVSFGSGTPFEVQPSSHLRARLVAEAITMRALAEWFKRNGLVSFGKVQLIHDGDSPQVGGFLWCLTAPTYLAPLVERSGTAVSPGFVVADVLLADELDTRSFQFFLRKAASLLSRRGVRPCVPVIMAVRFSEEALRLGKSKGLWLTTPSNFFGEELGRALLELIVVLRNAAAAAAQNPDSVIDLFEKLGRIEGAASNLRGPLFEMIVGHCVREAHGNSIDIGTEVCAPNGDRVEIDVLRVKERQEVWAYECKGYSPTRLVTSGEIDHWLGTTVPRIHKWILAQDRFRGARIGFEFWTSSGFDEGALEMLRNRSGATRKYTIGWRDGPGVYEFARGIRSGRIVDVLREQFVRHPLSMQ